MHVYMGLEEKSLHNIFKQHAIILSNNYQAKKSRFHIHSCLPFLKKANKFKYEHDMIIKLNTVVIGLIHL